MTDDPSELDVSELGLSDISSVDELLYKGIQEGLAADGMKLTHWMGSQLNQASTLKGLLTAYIVLDQGKERQFISLRLKSKGRKILIVGVFDIEGKESLARPIFDTLKDMVLLP